MLLVFTELVSLGESRFNVYVRKDLLLRARSTSKTATKFALSVVEFLLTAEECRKDLTMYGEGRGKMAVDANKRNALRSKMLCNQ
jgi:hypothetical protein